jgi:ABC-type amino acid transport substrate-binding protein
MPNIHILVLRLLASFTLTLLTFSQVNSRELIIFSSDAPPHMIAANNSGIDIDIVKTILTEMGHNISIEFSPLKRGMEQVKKKEADIFLPTFFQEDSDTIFISNAFIQYRPMIFSLKKNKLSINNFAELRGLRIVSFQGATEYFGKEFHQATQQTNYTELHDMSKFPEMLLMDRYDAVVLDYYIFYYFLKMYQEQSELAGNGLFPLIDNYSSLIKRHDLIPEVNAYVGFNNKLLRNEFNHKLKQFIDNNRQNKIIEKYIGTISSRILALNSQHQSTS